MAVQRLAGGNTPANGGDPRTFPAIWNGTADDLEAFEYSRLIGVHHAIKRDTQTSTSVAAGDSVDVVGLSVTLTPKSDSSKFYISAVLSGASSSTAVLAQTLRIVRDSTQIFTHDSPPGTTTAAPAAAYIVSNSDASIITQTFTGVDSPNTASEITYKVQIGNHGTTLDLFVNRPRGTSTNAFYSRTVSTLTVMEFA
jgi:hypothetical protein